VDATIDLNDVRLLVEVVHAASFTSAAKARGVPVSTVSRRVARLERDVGTMLLERTTRRLRLTDAGRRFFGHAERALDELTEGANGVRSLASVPRGHVRITAPIGIGAMLTTSLASYLAEHPHVTVEVDLTDRRVDLLAEGFDIAFRSGEVDSPDFVGKLVYASSRGLFASKDYLKRRGRPKNLADLARHDLIAMRASSRGAVWDLVTRGGRTKRFTFTPRLVVNEMMAARSAAVAGGGIAFLPEQQTNPALARVLPEIGGSPGGMWLLYPARRSVTAAVRSCVDHLLSTLPQR
jgi:DNA-binding transcriptional LysR family regulator